MAEFPVNSERLDPYENFEFRIEWHGHYVAGFSECSMLERTTEVITYQDGRDLGASRKSPGRTEYDAITLERGGDSRHRVRELGGQCVEPRGRSRVVRVA